LNLFLRSDQFKFSKLSQNWKQEQKTKVISPKKPSQRTIPCNDALLVGANKRSVLLYNMNVANILYIYDIQKDETKEFQWDEGTLARDIFLT
jgi:hypothetical protein